MSALISQHPATSQQPLFPHKWHGLDMDPKAFIYLSGPGPQFVITLEELCIMPAPADDITIAGWNISCDMGSWLCGAARAFIKNSISLIKRLELDSCFLIVVGFFCSGFITSCRQTWKIGKAPSLDSCWIVTLRCAEINIISLDSFSLYVTLRMKLKYVIKVEKIIYWWVNKYEGQDKINTGKILYSHPLQLRSRYFCI